MMPRQQFCRMMPNLWLSHTRLSSSRPVEESVFLPLQFTALPLPNRGGTCPRHVLLTPYFHHERAHRLHHMLCAQSLNVFMFSGASTNTPACLTKNVPDTERASGCCACSKLGRTAPTQRLCSAVQSDAKGVTGKQLLLSLRGSGPCWVAESPVDGRGFRNVEQAL